MSKKKAQERPSDTGMTRRAFLQSLGLAVSGALVGNYVLRAFDSFTRSAAFITPQGSFSKDTLDWAASLFGDLRHSSALPGRAHLDFPGGIHPDILHPFEELTALLHHSGCDIVPATLDDLPMATLDEQLLLIGGPASNLVARAWQGYTQNPKTGVCEFTGSDVARRWRFEFVVDPRTSPQPMRYINHELRRSRPEALRDELTPGYLRFAGVDSHSGLLTEDILLITFIPNPFSNRGTSMLDISDLHGKGNSAFIELLSNKNRLQVLTDELHRENIPLGTPFQALYTVFVDHDQSKKITQCKDLSTPVVARIG